VIAKPFAFTELAARVRAVRRRAMSVRLQLVHLVMDRLGHSLQRSGHAIDLSPKEFALPEFQKRHAGQPVSRSTIVEQVWRLTVVTMTIVVGVYINYLLRKVDPGHGSALMGSFGAPATRLATTVSSPNGAPICPWRNGCVKPATSWAANDPQSS